MMLGQPTAKQAQKQLAQLELIVFWP